MKTTSMCLMRLLASLLVAAWCLFPVIVGGANITWIGGNADWVDNAGATNWDSDGIPNDDEPDLNDRAIFNTANTVNLGSNNEVNGLALSGGIDLLTNEFDLTVDGLVEVAGAGSNLIIDDSAGSVDADDVTINASGTIELRGGTLTLNEEVGTSLIDINANGNLFGNGIISFADVPGVLTTVLVNDGALTALSRGLTILSPPPVGTLQINTASGTFTRVDLDGAGEAGVVNVNRNQTFDLNVGFADSFNGTLNLFQESHFNSLNAWTLAGGSIIVNNGFIDNPSPTPDVPAGTAFIEGGLLTQTGGTINVADTDGTLQLDVNFTMSGGSFTNFGTVVFNGITNITTAAGYAPASINSQMIVNADVTINDAAGNFNWDGGGAADTTINGAAELSITANQIDTTDNIFGGTITLNNGGDLTVNNTANSWTMFGTLDKTGPSVSTIGGDAVTISGSISVGGTGTLDMPTTTLSSMANVNVTSRLLLGGASVLAGPATLDGSGELEFEGTSTVTANTTVNVATFDWDGIGTGTSHTINSGVSFIINSTTFDNDGDMDDPINIGGSGAALTVNNVPSWTMTGTLTSNTTGLGITSINGNSRMILAGPMAVWNANGQTAVNAPVTFGASSITNISGAGFIRLNGGDAVSVFNQIEGGAINGPGALIAINSTELRGFGAIGSPITFQNTSSLRADDGTLTVSGPINEVFSIGTADADGVLNVVNAWNSNVATNVVLNGGALQGGAITVANPNGIKGRGLVSSRVVNNTRLEANLAAQTLVFETAANDNDWDGAANTGILAASNGGTLEVRDTASFTYGGTVNASGGSRVYAKGFGFNFSNASTINLTASTLQTDESTSIGGAINVAAGGQSTINVQVNRFLTLKSTSTTTLNDNLRLQTNNGAIEAGAMFSGPGAVIVPVQSHLILEANSNVNTLLVNQGTIRPAGFNTVGAAAIKDYEQAASGLLEVELTGTMLNQYDRLTMSGVAQLDGALVIDIDGAFVPVLGNTFNIITAVFGVTGTFDHADVSGMPAGLAFHINYLPTTVQLQVVAKPSYSADFDDDGDVDSTDLSIWKNAFNLNQLGDADGDNDSDGNDLLLWQRQKGAVPTVAVAGAVPEPGCFALCLGSLATWCGWRRQPAV